MEKKALVVAQKAESVVFKQRDSEFNDFLKQFTINHAQDLTDLTNLLKTDGINSIKLLSKLNLQKFEERTTRKINMGEFITLESLIEEAQKHEKINNITNQMALSNMEGYEFADSEFKDFIEQFERNQRKQISDLKLFLKINEIDRVEILASLDCQKFEDDVKEDIKNLPKKSLPQTRKMCIYYCRTSSFWKFN